MLSLFPTYPALLPLTKLTSSLVGFFYNCFLNDLPASTRPPAHATSLFSAQQPETPW